VIPDLAIVLVAAGSSTRMGFDKLWADLCGKPLLAHAVAAAASAASREVVIVAAAARVEDARRLAPSACVVPGGARRRDSVAAGLAACTAAWVAIHDAARALVPPELFERGLAAAQATGVAIPVLPLKDTIKRVACASVVETVPRAELAAVQTPQVFRRDLLLQAMAHTDADVTDEATLCEQLGISVATFAGDERAFKVTTPLDFALARTLLELDAPRR
jgi:2-C-methyl-D-erythritol 4-phosphate cytidylyltransferase / 2-C-methyl-D-erythritol 2,4-cyclodiphosphate synthase